MLVFYLFVPYEGLLPYKPGNWHISANLDIGNMPLRTMARYLAVPFWRGYTRDQSTVATFPMIPNSSAESAELQIVDPVVDDHVRILQVDHKVLHPNGDKGDFKPSLST